VPRARIAGIAIGAKVRVSKNVIAKTGIEPLKRAIAAREKRGPRAYRVQARGGRYVFSFRDADATGRPYH
jgi:hypothetical protein